MRESSTNTPTLALLFPWKGTNQAVPAILAPGIPTRELRKVTQPGLLTFLNALRNSGAFSFYILLALVLFSTSLGLKLVGIDELSGFTESMAAGMGAILISALISSRLLIYRERRFLDRWAPRIMIGNSLVEEVLVIAQKQLTGQPVEQLVDTEKRLVHMAACVAHSESVSNENMGQLLNLALEYRETRDPDALAQAAWIHDTAHVMNEHPSDHDEDPW